MRSSAEILGEIRRLENDKGQLVALSALVKDIGEGLLNISMQLMNTSDKLYDGFNIDNKRVDGNLHEEAEKFKNFAHELLSLLDELNAEIANVEQIISDKWSEYYAAVERENAIRRQKELQAKKEANL